MKCKGEFVYKGIEERPAGEFINSQGRNIKYDSSYSLKVDEVTEKGIYDRKLKVSKDNSVLLEQLKSKKPYDRILLECDVVMYGSNCKVVPLQIIEGNNK